MKEGEPKFDEENIERETGISKLVGLHPDDEVKLTEIVKGIFQEQKIQQYERPKTKEELETIESILEKMPEFVRRYGGNPVPLEPKHIHFLDANKMPPLEPNAITAESGFYSTRDQLIGVVDRNNPLLNARNIVHETLHFNSFLSVGIGKDCSSSVRRLGFEIKTYDEEILFKTLNEAVIEELTARFHKEYFNSIPNLPKENYDSNLTPDYDIFSLIYAKERTILWTVIRDICYKRLGIPISEEDFDELAQEELEGELDKKKREDLSKIKEEVFDLFARTVMSGKLLPVARSVEETYGKGSFRKLGEITK